MRKQCNQKEMRLERCLNWLKMLRERREGSEVFWRCDENRSEGNTHPMGDNSPGEAMGTGQEEIDSLKPPLAR